MNIYNKFFIGIVLTINLLSFLIMFVDKEKAKRADRRVSERSLFLWALFLGAGGVYLGMLAFRHKTRKWYFFLGIPLLILINAYIINLIYLAFSSNIG